MTAASGAAAQTVELSSRTFWLGEVPREVEDDPPFFAPQRIAWLNAIIEEDPILRETVFHVDMVPLSIPVSDTIPVSVRIADRRDDVLLSREQVPEHMYLEGFDIYGPSNGSLARLEYFPSDPSAGFRVGCTQNEDMLSVSLCVVRATYPPDDLIWLKARLYFPENPADRPDFFHRVAERMREFAYCLDVTETPSNPREDNPALTGCDWEVSS
ncbi:hypothetical protein [Hasllibacter sp. MH4015]|uniref:hypothetical protein n=1 Tax=Hasllibacter sp. MH4015 TaxID=2854029 RepID=UPI001CD1EA92|nr:hypothetical protein [Hasllibacter sp. MH4015]